MRVERIGTDVRLHPGGPARGSFAPPGSKSITNRYLTCAALADGVTTLRGASMSDDALRMTDGLRALGVRVDVDAAAAELHVSGCHGQIPAGEAEIDAGLAGTAMRFLTALATLGRGRYRLDGAARMRQRPIGALVGALQALGGGIGYDEREGYPPLVIAGRGLAGGQAHLLELQSSQYVSALLMVAPYAAQDVYLAVEGDLPSQPYVAMTMDVMRSMGVEVLEHEGRFVVPAGQRYQPGVYGVEPDASAATYLWAAAAITGGSVRVPGLTRASRQGDAHFVDVLAQMGCTVDEGPDYLEVTAPASGRLCGIDVDLNDMPDTVQTLAVTALFADGPTTVRNVANLRVKETDRLAALGTELTRLGARVETRDDGLTVHPPTKLEPAEIETYDDHRMAMSFALAGLVCDGVVIREADCVSKSFPGYFDVMGKLG